MIRLLPLVFVLAAPASAACLDESAVDRGVVLHLSGDVTVTVTRIEGDLMQVVTESRTRGVQSEEALFGLFELTVTRKMDDGFEELATITYDPPPVAPKQGEPFQTVMTRVSPTETTAFLYSYHLGKSRATWPHDDCLYEIYHVMRKLELSDGTWVQQGVGVWFPELGFGFRGNGERTIAGVVTLP